MSEEDDIDMGDYSTSLDNLLTPPRRNEDITITTTSPHSPVVPQTPIQVNVNNDNEESIRRYISRRLHIFDLLKKEDEPLPIKSLSDENERFKLLQIIHDLIKQREQDLETMDNLTDEISRIKQDELHHQANLEEKKNVEKELKSQLGETENILNKVSDGAKRTEESLKREKQKKILMEKNYKAKLKQTETNKQKLERLNQTLKDRITKLQQQPGSPKEFILNMGGGGVGLPTSFAIPQRRGKGENRKKMGQQIRNEYLSENKELQEEMNVLRASIRSMIEQVYLLRRIVYRRKGTKEFIPIVKEKLVSFTSSSSSSSQTQQSSSSSTTIKKRANINLIPAKYSKQYIDKTLKKLIEEVKEVCDVFFGETSPQQQQDDEDDDDDSQSSGFGLEAPLGFAEEDFVDQYNSISRILIDCLTDDEEKYQRATGILESFNLRMYYLQDLLLQQNNFLTIEVKEQEKRDLFKL